MNILTDLFQFLRKPDFVSIQDNAGNKIKILFTLFLCLLVIMFGMNVVVRILQVIVTNISLTFSTQHKFLVGGKHGIYFKLYY